MSHDGDTRHVVIVGGGVAGLGCAQRLAEHDDVHVTVIDRNNYHQFQPLLYQMATSQRRARKAASWALTRGQSDQNAAQLPRRP